MIASTSPLCAPIRMVNLSITFPMRPSLLFSARASSRFLTVLSPPIGLVIWLIIADLSSALKVGDEMIETSLASRSRLALRVCRDLSVASRDEVLADAVYYSARREG